MRADISIYSVRPPTQARTPISVPQLMSCQIDFSKITLKLPYCLEVEPNSYLDQPTPFSGVDLTRRAYRAAPVAGVGD